MSEEDGTCTIDGLCPAKWGLDNNLHKNKGGEIPPFLLTKTKQSEKQNGNIFK